MLKKRVRKFYNALLVVTTLVAVLLFAMSVITLDAKDTNVPTIAAVMSISWIMLFCWANAEKYEGRY